MIKELTHLTEDAVSRLLEIWESSVLATHHFLAEKDILSLKPLVKQAIMQINRLKCYEDEQGTIQGFIGVDNNKIEMLFIHDDMRGHGIGSLLLQDAVRSDAIYVDVNEQNSKGIGFYEHMGFEVVGRSELDDQGNPFPILHMKLRKA